MKQYQTFEYDELLLQLEMIYDKICNSIRKAALLHVSTMTTNSSYHFTSMLESANLSIMILRNIFPDGDVNEQQFVTLNAKELIEEASDFLNSDLY